MRFVKGEEGVGGGGEGEGGRGEVVGGVEKDGLEGGVEGDGEGGGGRRHAMELVWGNGYGCGFRWRLKSSSSARRFSLLPSYFGATLSNLESMQ